MAFFPSSKPQRIACFGMLVLCWLYILYQLFNTSLPVVIEHPNTRYKPVMGEIVDKKVKNNFTQKEDLQSKPLKLESFDPNTVSLEKMLWMGIPARTAHTIRNYIKKGGYFETSDDLKKIYTLEEALFQKLRPFITIKKEKVPATPIKAGIKKELKKVDAVAVPKQEKKPSIVKPVCLNSASDSLLQTVQGIGPYFTRKILAFRQKTGGFYSKEQLLLIPKMDSTRFVAITPQLEIRQQIRKTLLDNSVPFKKVNALIGYQHTKLLYNYMNQHGAIENRSELNNIVWISEKEKEILQAYFDIKK